MITTLSHIISLQFFQASFLEPYMDDKSSQTKIGRVEQFMVGLLATPDHTPRLRVLRTKKIFEDLETDYRPTFELLHVATKELMMSRSLKELLHIILLTGNFINGVRLILCIAKGGRNRQRNRTEQSLSSLPFFSEKHP
ncbi:Formin-H [Geodia barretti]|uniref:Formin-H n=1 Tax=Geodia barretti TaxID=519541 RepID=A0AA35TE05_GEOBA|nr:Formin-H [Geodia barretti]